MARGIRKIKPKKKRYDKNKKSLSSEYINEKKLPQKKKIKKNSSNQVIPTYNYIRLLLWKNHKKDFKSYFDSDFLNVVKDIYYQCKDFKKCTDKVVLKRYTKSKKNKKQSGFYGNKNNFTYIRSIIWRNHKSDFKSYFDDELFSIVKEIFNDCKAAGTSCTEEIILYKYKELISNRKRPKPFILSYFLEPRYYYEIKDVPFQALAPYLYVVSTMIIPFPHEFIITDYFKKIQSDKGSQIEIIGYNKYFSQWVNWCNAAMRNEHGNEYGSEELEICFKMTDAEYNEDKKRWETNIYICTPSGKIESFGYKPEEIYDKNYEPEYRIPSTNELIESPVFDKEQNKIKRITRKQKIKDAIIYWEDFFSDLKKTKEKLEVESYAKKIEENINARNNIENLIRKYNKLKNKEKVSELEDEFDRLVAEYLKLLRMRNKNK
jgi:hypothetical protein